MCACVCVRPYKSIKQAPKGQRDARARRVEHFQNLRIINQVLGESGDGHLERGEHTKRSDRDSGRRRLSRYTDSHTCFQYMFISKDHSYSTCTFF